MSNLKEKIDFVNSLYGLILEANLHKPAEEILSEIDIRNDVYLSNSISFIRRLNTQAKATLNKGRFEYAQKVLSELINTTGNNIDAFLKELISEPENEKMMAFFKNYQSLSDSDKKAMLLDSKILEIITKAKNKLDTSSNND